MRLAVALSGGADSVALLRILTTRSGELGLVLHAVHLHHGLRGAEADADLEFCRELAAKLGLPFHEAHVDTCQEAEANPKSGKAAETIEEAARRLRYAWFRQLMASENLEAIATAHTLDDQAETVLLGLARGSGGRSLAGMPLRRGPYRRPLLGVRRATTSAACAELGLEPWQDPHNRDFRFARARVRHQALPALESALGPGVAEALARTASQLRADAECLDDLAFAESAKLRGCASDPAGLDAGWLRALPAAIRARVLRDAAIMAGCPSGALTAGHVGRVDALVTGWRGQRWVDLPGSVRARRQAGKVWFTASAPGGSAPGGSAPGGSAPGD